NTIIGASVSSITTTSAQLSWQAPADLPGGGAAASYDIRYSNSPITEINFGSATALTGEPSPAAPGTVQTYVIAGLNPSTVYYTTIKSQDAVGNVSLISNVVNFTTQAPADVSPPTTPTGLSTTAVLTSQINVIWNASSDNVGVIRYRLERCQDVSCATFAEIATPNVTNYSNTGLAVNTTYQYRVRAEDAAGNLSGYSTIASAATTDTVAPTVSITSPASNDTVAGTIPVTANATDNIGVLGVQFLLDGVNLGSEDTTAPYSISWNTTSVLDGSHILTARARDAAANVTTSGGITVNVLNNPPPPFNFSLSSDGNKGVAQGASVANTITATLVSGTTRTVSFSASGFPSGATGVFLPINCDPGCSTVLTITTLPTTPVGPVTITVTGVGNGTTRTVSFQLSVTPPPSNKFKNNDRIAVRSQSGSGAEVRSSASISSTLLTTQPDGTLGTVVGGPIFADGLHWWQIDYDTTGGIGTNTDGWSVEDNLLIAVFATGAKFAPHVEGNVLATRNFTVNVLQRNASTTLFTFTSLPDAQQEIPITITTLLEGTYDLLVHSPSFLKEKVNDVVITSSTVITLPALRGGDFNNDGVINEIDWSFMNPRWFSTDATADLNGDGVVNSVDFSYMNKNWNAVGN
ncbi:MAG: Ig-like domain-containing protein, partial [Patescibacteria group bacterium]